MGAGLGFVMGIAFTVIALLQFDDTETSAVDVATVSLLVGLPFSSPSSIAGVSPALATVAADAVRLVIRTNSGKIG